MTSPDGSGGARWIPTRFQVVAAPRLALQEALIWCGRRAECHAAVTGVGDEARRARGIGRGSPEFPCGIRHRAQPRRFHGSGASGQGRLMRRVLISTAAWWTYLSPMAGDAVTQGEGPPVDPGAVSAISVAWTWALSTG